MGRAPSLSGALGIAGDACPDLAQVQKTNVITALAGVICTLLLKEIGNKTSQASGTGRKETSHGTVLGISGVKLPGSGSPGEVVLFSDALLAYFRGFSCVVAAGVDHCAEQDHGCEQLCLNTEDSFVCQCSEGFLINDDLKTCSRECPSCFSYREELCRQRGERDGRRGRRAPPCPLLVAPGEMAGLSPGDRAPSRGRRRRVREVRGTVI